MRSKPDPDRSAATAARVVHATSRADPRYVNAHRAVVDMAAERFLRCLTVDDFRAAGGRSALARQAADAFLATCHDADVNLGSPRIPVTLRDAIVADLSSIAEAARLREAQARAHSRAREDSRTRKVAKALGRAPAAADIDALRRAHDHMEAALAALDEAVGAVTPRMLRPEVPREYVYAARGHVENVLKTTLRAVEPLAVGGELEVIEHLDRTTYRQIDARFLGVDEHGFVLLTSDRTGPFEVHRMQAEGAITIPKVERFRVEAWVREQRAAGLLLADNSVAVLAMGGAAVSSLESE